MLSMIPPHRKEEEEDRARIPQRRWQIQEVITLQTFFSSQIWQVKLGSYNKYTDKQIVKFLEMVQNVTLNVRKAAKKMGFDLFLTTARRYWKHYTDDKAYLPSMLSKRGGSKGVLTEEHSRFLENVYDDDVAATLQ